MTGIYFSGTGNTRHCIEKLTGLLDPLAQTFSLEDPLALKAIEQEDFILFGYPTQFSNIPYFVREFIISHAVLWKRKQIFVISTMGLFSGDGTGCGTRLLQKYDAIIKGGLLLRMPEAISDKEALQKHRAEYPDIIHKTDVRIEKAALMMREGIYPQEGLRFRDRLLGFFGQRVWTNSKTKGYSSSLKISDSCTGCNHCVQICPMHNLTLAGSKAVSDNHCTMCYRCINTCPQKAITLLGSEIKKQQVFPSE